MSSRPDPCENCRRNHVKCDDSGTTCQRCLKAGQECVRHPRRVKFRHGSTAKYDSEFSRDQIWMNPLANGTTSFDFIDETPDLAAFYRRDSLVVYSQGSDYEGKSASPSSEIESYPPSTNVPTTFPLPTDGSAIFSSESSGSLRDIYGDVLSPESTQLGISQAAMWCHPSSTAKFSQQSHATAMSPENKGSFKSPLPTSSRYDRSHSLFPPLFVQEDSIWPNLDVEQACLLRYFIENLARWFDLCDPERHFTRAVPQKACTCPPLLNAILSASARHLCTLPKHCRAAVMVKYSLPRIMRFGEETALYYHSKCISQMRSLSHDPDALMDENLLAAVVILRFYEEIDAPLGGLSGETALRGLQVFIEAQAASAFTGNGLRQMAFWVGVRQEIHMAFLQQRSFRLPLTFCDSYRSWEPAPDHIWANRLIIFCADVLQFCFNDTSTKDHARYEELIDFPRKWLKYHPRSFAPTYYREPDRTKNEVLPQLWYAEDFHIAGIQHMILAMILLTVYKPNVPRLGLGQREAMIVMDSNIKSMVLEICGIAVSNRQCPPSLLTATIAITMCGDRFTDAHEQQALLDVLIETDQDNAWPTASMQANLKKAWGWERSSSTTT
ncbi:transcriptional regulator family: Fungal Specific TF [Paecilomyces variotii]|nr:transcriptional regulator family: Fungal Specific TF [Paecilomyces variotii]